MNYRVMALWLPMLLIGSVEALRAENTADIVILNGSVFTGTGDDRPTAEAVAIKGNEILRVGSNESVEALEGPATQRIDANGGSVLPGFNDNHVHFVSASLGLDRVLLQDANSLAAILERIKKFADARPGEEWILGRGWFYAPFPGGLPTREQLDRAVPDRPAFMVAYDAHTGWANSKALAVAGIDRNTPDPPNGIVVKDPATGEPTGVLKEAAQSLVSDVIPEATTEEKLEAMRKGQRHVLRYGVTSVQNAILSEEDLALYDELRRRGELSVRTYSALKIDPGFSSADADRYGEVRSRYRDDDPYFRLGAVKILADGVIEAHTAYMLEPYEGLDSRGLPNFSEAELRQIITMMDRRGWQIFTHAIGDAAVRAALDAYEHANRVNREPKHGRRHRIEHVETVQSRDISRFGRLGVIAAMQPFHANPSPNQLQIWAGNIGRERASRAWVWGSIMKSGGVVTFGTDWGVIAIDPIPGLNMAIYRTTPEGEPAGGWLPSERISLADAIRNYTHNPAYSEFREEFKGTLEPGKWADIVILSNNLFSSSQEELLDAIVDWTIIDGKVVYQRPRSVATQ